ncbi:RPAP1-like protein [Dimargaris cristalligena]|uniref:RPAP1-like protein n=1 Tax=Dimargaris cristalligena TaxID=215637 RepID=A0A4P9ZQF9_9FUNG|nr:RPAP1-like protein [Dimargaris cristalligena]|eukprot:RKP34630.1 RPAP1-like protein [Dimargaris cristalligena]
MGRDYGATTASGPTIFSPDRRLTAHSPLAPFAGETTVSRLSHTKPTRSWAGSLEREIGLTAEQIHEQNERLLADMTEDEIREAQEEILGMLPPDVVKGLLQRNAPAPESSESAASLKSNHSDPMPRESNAQANANTDTNTNTETAEAETQFLRQLKERYFPNLPTEYEKLEWMGVCKPPVETTPTPMVAPASMPTLAQSDTTTDALPAESTCPPLRFDFRGMILPENTDLPVHKGLHHHGDRPDQAGYTLAELLYLARSAVAVQRVLPLRMLGQILGRCQQALLSDDDTTPVPAPEPEPESEPVVDPKKSGKSRSVPIGRYPPDLATDILAYFHRARLPLYLMNSLYESHRTCIMTALDVLYGLLLPQGEPSLVPVPVQSIPPTTPFATPHHQFAEANLLAADRLAAQSTYTGLIQMGLVARLADLLGPRSPVVLLPMARYHALLLLWALVKVAGPRELAMDKDAVKALEKVLQSPSAPSESESSGVVAETDEDTHPAQMLDGKLKSLSTYLLTQIKPESDHKN